MISIKNKHKLIAVLEHKNYQEVGDALFVFPDDTVMLSNLLKISNRYGITVIPIGFGSSFEERSFSEKDIVFLSSQKLTKLEVDKNNSFATLQAGCEWNSVFDGLAKEGMFFPLDTSELNRKRSAGGIFSSLRPDSAASNYFTGIEFLTSDGTIVKYGSMTLKNVAGYDLVKFMTGTFGCFGFVTSLTVRLLRTDRSFFSFENINDVCGIRSEMGTKGIYGSLKSILDPNSVFY